MWVAGMHPTRRRGLAVGAAACVIMAVILMVTHRQPRHHGHSTAPAPARVSNDAKTLSVMAEGGSTTTSATGSTSTTSDTSDTSGSSVKPFTSGVIPGRFTNASQAASKGPRLSPDLAALVGSAGTNTEATVSVDTVRTKSQSLCVTGGSLPWSCWQSMAGAEEGGPRVPPSERAGAGAICLADNTPELRAAVADDTCLYVPIVACGL